MFLGRPQRSVTIYHYGDDGQLEWSETLTEADWSDEDREAALHREDEKAQICPSCGRTVAECSDKTLRAAWTAEAVPCFATQAVARMASNAGNPPGVRYRARNRASD